MAEKGDEPARRRIVNGPATKTHPYRLAWTKFFALSRRPGGYKLIEAFAEAQMHEVVRTARHDGEKPRRSFVCSGNWQQLELFRPHIKDDPLSTEPATVVLKPDEEPRVSSRYKEGSILDIVHLPGDEIRAKFAGESSHS